MIRRIAGSASRVLHHLLYGGRMSPAEMYPLGSGSVTSRFVELASGDRIRVAECGPADGRPLMLLHGWGGSVYAWRKNMPTLGAAGYRVVTADLLGHGLSDKPLDAARYRWPALLAHVAQILDALDIPVAGMIGQSLGGHLALAFARDHPDRVSAVAVVNATGLGPIPGIRVVKSLAGLPPSLHLPITSRRFMVKRIMRYTYGTLGDFAEHDVDEYWAPSQFPEWGRVLVTLLRAAPWSQVPRGEFVEMRQPVLAILSSDRLVRCREDDAKHRLPPSSTIVQIPGGGHLVNEEAPEPVNAALLEFLAAS